MYKVKISSDALEHLLKLQKSQPQAYKKFNLLLRELAEHPQTGTGKPEQLKGSDGVWSRRFDKKNRIRYEIHDDKIIVLVLSALGHYVQK